MSAKVSVCVPVYNGARFIEATLRSIVEQTYEDFELVIVDNVSNDDTVARVQAFDDARIRLVQADRHVSAIENFTRATDSCSGEYVKLVCADDTLDPSCLELQVAALDRDPSVAVVAARRAIVDANDRPLIRAHGLNGMQGVVDGRVAIRRCVRSGTNLLGEPAAVLMRAAALKRAGTWGREWPYVTDLDLWFRLLHEGNLAALQEVLATFRVHVEGWSGSMAGTQARQLRHLFAREASTPHTRVSGRDRALGGVRASALQYGRRILYALHRRRDHGEGRNAPPTAHPHDDVT